MTKIKNKILFDIFLLFFFRKKVSKRKQHNWPHNSMEMEFPFWIVAIDISVGKYQQEQLQSQPQQQQWCKVRITIEPSPGLSARA